MNRERRHRQLYSVPDLQVPGRRDAPRFRSGPRIGQGAGAPGEIPESVLLEMAGAAELWESLEAEGKQLRYEIDAATGRVSAELRDRDGARLRVVPLTQALGASDDDSPAA